MNKQGQFGLFETTALVTVVIISKIFYTSIAAVVKSTGTAAWYETIISCIVSIVFFLMIYPLVKRFPNMDLTEIYEAVLGKALGKVVMFAWPCYLIYYGAICSREFFEVIKTYVLPNTQDGIIYISFIGVMVLIAYKGIENIARLSYISFFPIIAGFLLILILAYPFYNPDYLKPYMGYGLKNTITIGIMRSSAYEEVLTLILILKSIHGTDNFLKAGLISLILSGVIFFIAVISYIMMFSYSVGSENLSGMFHIARTIFFSRYFQRMETIFLFPWVVTSIITCGNALYLALYLYSTVFKIKDYKPLILPFSFLIYMLAVIPKNVIEFLNIYLAFIRQYSFGFAFGVPILVLSVAAITGKRGEKPNAKKN